MTRVNARRPPRRNNARMDERADHLAAVETMIADAERLLAKQCHILAGGPRQGPVPKDSRALLSALAATLELMYAFHACLVTDQPPAGSNSPGLGHTLH